MREQQRRKKRIQEAVQGIQGLRKAIAEDDEHIDYLTKVIDRMQAQKQERLDTIDVLKEQLLRVCLEGRAVALYVRFPAWPEKRFGGTPAIRVVFKRYVSGKEEVVLDQAFHQGRGGDLFAKLRPHVGNSFSPPDILLELMRAGHIEPTHKIVLEQELYRFKADKWVAVTEEV